MKASSQIVPLKESAQKPKFEVTCSFKTDTVSITSTGARVHGYKTTNLIDHDVIGIFEYGSNFCLTKINAEHCMCWWRKDCTLQMKAPITKAWWPKLGILVL